MDCDHIGWNVAHSKTTDVGGDSGLLNGHHGNGFVGGEPIGFVVTASVVTDTVEVAEDKWC